MSISRKVELLFLDKKTVDSLLDYSEVVRVVEDTFRADAEGKLELEPSDPMNSGGGSLLAMPSYLPLLGTAGVKWLGYFKKEAGSPVPISWGNILILNEDKYGQPFAILDCTSITAYRTGGGHAVAGARAFARKGAKTAGILGAGSQGKAAALSFDRAFELDTIFLYSKPEEQRDALIAEIEPKLRAKIKAVDSAEEIAGISDILVTATGSQEVIIRAEWIKKGAAVSAVSSFGDLDPAITKKADKWFIGQRKSDGAHIIHTSRFEGILDERDVRGTIGEVLTGKVKGRESDDETIVFSHMGMGALDVAVGKHVYDLAVSRGLGQKLQLSGEND